MSTSRDPESGRTDVLRAMIEAAASRRSRASLRFVVVAGRSRPSMARIAVTKVRLRASEKSGSSPASKADATRSASARLFMISY